MIPVSLRFPIKSVASQFASFVGVNDNTDDLRCGNVKISDWLLKLPDQEKEEKLLEKVGIPNFQSGMKTVGRSI